MATALIPAIFLFYGILSCAYAFVLLLSRPKVQRIAVTYWACGALLTGIATFITVFRNESNLLFTYVGANGIVFIGYLSFNYAVQSMAGRTSSIKKNLLTSCVIFVGYCIALHFIGIYLGSKYQTVFVSTLVSLSALSVGIFGLQIYKKNRINHAAILAITAFISCIVWAARVPLALSDIAINAFSTNSLNSFIFICIFLLGMLWYFIFIALLYTEANRAEFKALQRFEGMSQTLPCALYEFYLYPDYTSEFRYISPSIKELIGHSPEAVMKDSSLIIEQVHPDDKERFWEVNLEAYNTGKTFFIEMRLIVLDGSTKWMQLSSAPRGKDFKNVTWSGYIIDITERKEFEEKAKKVDILTSKNIEISKLLIEKEQLIASVLKANKTSVTGALSASIAHELNQPIGASNLNIQFLQKKLDQDEFSPEIAKKILSLLAYDNNRVGNIIKSLRSIFLDDEVISTNCQLSDVLESVITISDPEVKKLGIILSIDAQDQLTVFMNDTELKQVLLNLLNNAIRELSKNKDAPKRILIEGSKTQAMTTISISDNGSGVDLDRQENLFELLNNEKNAGMGLGLWLCKHIVTRYGGNIAYEKSDIGGAKFTISIPNEFNTLEVI
jgi:PAS domain S-box-containing protein